MANVNKDKDKSWFRPDVLLKEHIDYPEKTRVYGANPHDDFGSYRILLDSGDLKKSLLKFHNDTNPEYKLGAVKRFLKKNTNKSCFESILNLGCGVGFETLALSRTFNTRTLGIDISSDAIQYAKNNNNNELTNYECRVVDRNFLTATRYDVAFCIEFYPFTRTNDLDFQIEIINAIFSNLNDGSMIVLYHLDVPGQTINDNLTDLNNVYKIRSIIGGRFHPAIYRITNSFYLTDIILYYISLFFKRVFSRRIIILQK